MSGLLFLFLNKRYTAFKHRTKVNGLIPPCIINRHETDFTNKDLLDFQVSILCRLTVIVGPGCLHSKRSPCTLGCLQLCFLTPTQPSVQKNNLSYADLLTWSGNTNVIFNT